MAIRDRIERLGVYVDVVSKEEHVPEVERYIGICKERCRGIIHSLPFRLSCMLVVWLVYYVVMRVNQSLFDKTPGAVPPFCNFKLRKIDPEIDYRIGFGEYVRVHEDNGNYQNSMMSRSTGAIALCPTGNLSRSVKFLSLSTWKVLTRDRWTMVPMPQDVVLKLNAKAVKIPRHASQALKNDCIHVVRCFFRKTHHDAAGGGERESTTVFEWCFALSRRRHTQRLFGRFDLKFGFRV